MKLVYRLFKRGKYFYSHNGDTGKQESLGTSDRNEAQRLLTAKNEAANNSELTFAIGRAYLAAIDPEMLTRTWLDVMTLIQKRGKQSTQDRCCRALRSSAFDGIRNKVIMETMASHFLTVLSDNKQATSHYLKILQSSAVDLGWLVKPILARKCWPKIVPKGKRAITWEEHCKIIDCEKNNERRLYYEILWETGASQTDAANLSNDNINWKCRTLVYDREKTGQQSSITIGNRLEQMLRQLPDVGPLFPNLVLWDCVRRSVEFYRRCKVAKVIGVSLHSYRYAWAERAFCLGYPERFAQAALGHGSKAIHHGYAKNAKVNCPSLDEYAIRQTGGEVNV